ncbi:MAG: hypothetical protein ACLGHN_12855 [Bacteriovoracia bacterium]
MKWIKKCLAKLVHHHKRFEAMSSSQDGSIKTYHQEYVAFWK